MDVHFHILKRQSYRLLVHTVDILYPFGGLVSWNYRGKKRSELSIPDHLRTSIFLNAWIFNFPAAFFDVKSSCFGSIS